MNSQNSSLFFQRSLQMILERSPLAQVLPVCFGISLAPAAFSESFMGLEFVISVALTYGLLVQMRLGDEIKDYQRDLILNPNRPLPRGLLSLPEAKQLLRSVFILEGLCGSGMALLSTSSSTKLAGFLLLITTLYIYLMYREFLIGSQLSRHPYAYALSHQIVIFGVYGWVAAFYGSDLIGSSIFISWLTANFGASFSYEIARKLNPTTDPSARTYLQVSGPRITLGAIAVLIFVSLLAAKSGGFLIWTGPFLAVFLLMSTTLPTRPSAFRSIEGLSVLSAMMHLFFPVLRLLSQKILEVL